MFCIKFCDVLVVMFWCEVASVLVGCFYVRIYLIYTNLVVILELFMGIKVEVYYDCLYCLHKIDVGLLDLI